jgi:hypothetical protein
VILIELLPSAFTWVSVLMVVPMADASSRFNFFKSSAWVEPATSASTAKINRLRFIFASTIYLLGRSRPSESKRQAFNASVFDIRPEPRVRRGGMNAVQPKKTEKVSTILQVKQQGF